MCSVKLENGGLYLHRRQKQLCIFQPSSPLTKISQREIHLLHYPSARNLQALRVVITGILASVWGGTCGWTTVANSATLRVLRNCSNDCSCGCRFGSQGIESSCSGGSCCTSRQNEGNHAVTRNCGADGATADSCGDCCHGVLALRCNPSLDAGGLKSSSGDLNIRSDGIGVDHLNRHGSVCVLECSCLDTSWCARSSNTLCTRSDRTTEVCIGPQSCRWVHTRSGNLNETCVIGGNLDAFPVEISADTSTDNCCVDIVCPCITV